MDNPTFDELELRRRQKAAYGIGIIAFLLTELVLVLQYWNALLSLLPAIAVGILFCWLALKSRWFNDLANALITGITGLWI